MDFDLPPELEMLKQTVRKFVDNELIPVERESCTPNEQLISEFQEKFIRGAKAIGIWMMEVPAEYGGLGAGLLPRVVVWEELARSIALPWRGLTLTGPSVGPILYQLDDRGKQRYLLPVLRGEKQVCFAQTEPDAGSDPGAMRTTAVREGDSYVINGVKRFITAADKADFAQVMAVTDRAKGAHGGISCFLVEMDSPGVKVAAKYKTMMGDEPCEVVFDNVRVPVENRVGREGEGFVLAQRWIGEGRLRHGARALGVAERCLEMAGAYSKQRVTFGAPLAERQGVQWMLADAWVELHAARLMVYQAAWKADQGRDFRYESYVCKLYCDEMGFRAADRCMQIHGGIGLTTDLPIEKFWRQERSFRITEGASEVMRNVIARYVLRRY